MRLANACFWSSIFYTTILFCGERGEWGVWGHAIRYVRFYFLDQGLNQSVSPAVGPLNHQGRPYTPILGCEVFVFFFFFQIISLHDSFLCHFHASSKLHFISLSAQYKSPCSFLNQKALIESLNISLYIYLLKKRKHCFKGRSLGKAFLFES